MDVDTIACADCMDYLRSLPDACVDLVVTDPPYNVSQKRDMKFKGRTLVKNFGAWDYGFDPAPVLKELKRVLKPNGQLYVFCATAQIQQYMQILQNDWHFRNLLVWYKPNPIPRLNKNNYVFANEYILYAVNEKVNSRLVTFNFTKQTEMHNTVILPILQGKERLRQASGLSLHPTQKPLSILKKFISVSSNPGDLVLDPFMGVGSTALAAKLLGRQYLGCDSDEIYVAGAKLRLRQLNSCRDQ